MMFIMECRLNVSNVMDSVINSFSGRPNHAYAKALFYERVYSSKRQKETGRKRLCDNSDKKY